jgi:hypothetical protein
MPQDPNTLPDDGRLIPIVLGVVGHRDLPPDQATLSQLEAALRQVFEEFDQAYPNSPKILLSPLAPGADQLAVKVALERPCWSVRAPLPFEPDVFLQSTSFQTADENHNKVPDVAGRKEFERLLGHERVEWFVVPVPPEMRRSAAEWEQVVSGRPGEADEDKELRRACYANPGGYIVRHCHTLLALWDEKKATRPSGTAEIVQFQLSGVPPSLYRWVADEPLGFDGDRGPVIVLHTPRAGKPSDVPAGRWHARVPSEKDDQPYGEVVPEIQQAAWPLSRAERFGERIKRWLNIKPRRTGLQEYHQFLSICQTIEDFNREARAVKETDEAEGMVYGERLKQVDEDVARNFPDADPAGSLHPALRDWYRRFVRVRETAAHLSGRLSPTHTRLGLELFGLLFLVLLTFHFYAHPVWHTDSAQPEEHSWYLLAMFAGGWAVMAGLVAWVWWVRLEERRMDYRALAEALRLRRAWALAGINRSVSRTYLSQLRSEVAWVRRALQHLCPPSSFWEEQFGGLSQDRKLSRLQEVQTSWVQPQEKQHLTEEGKEHFKAFLYRVFGYGLALVGLILLLLLLGPWAGGSGPAEAGLDPAHPPHWLLVAGSSLIILGGLLIAICERRAHEELAKQYERMYVVFRSGARALTAALDGAPQNIARAQAIVGELGRESIQENSLWLLLRRSKPLELPLGG